MVWFIRVAADNASKFRADEVQTFPLHQREIVMRWTVLKNGLESLRDASDIGVLAVRFLTFFQDAHAAIFLPVF